MLGKKNSAYLIEFNPLKGTPYKLPDNISKKEKKPTLFF
jgi:hypothetical protein